MNIFQKRTNRLAEIAIFFRIEKCVAASDEKRETAVQKIRCDLRHGSSGDLVGIEGGGYGPRNFIFRDHPHAIISVAALLRHLTRQRAVRCSLQHAVFGESPVAMVVAVESGMPQKDLWFQ